jgi:hypothetical protein
MGAASSTPLATDGGSSGAPVRPFAFEKEAVESEVVRAMKREMERELELALAKERDASMPSMTALALARDVLGALEAIDGGMRELRGDGGGGEPALTAAEAADVASAETESQTAALAKVLRYLAPQIRRACTASASAGDDDPCPLIVIRSESGGRGWLVHPLAPRRRGLYREPEYFATWAPFVTFAPERDAPKEGSRDARVGEAGADAHAAAVRSGVLGGPELQLEGGVRTGALGGPELQLEGGVRTGALGGPELQLEGGVRVLLKTSRWDLSWETEAEFGELCRDAQ